jgi:uncharacterized protein
VILLVVAAVLVGSGIQRLSGMGFAMVLAPFSVIALGPSSGVVLVNLLGIVSAALVLARVRSAVEWRMLGRLLPASAVGVGLGVAVSTALSEQVAQVVAGAVVLVALGASLAVARVATVGRSRPLVVATSAASGAMAALAGVGGAAMVVLAVVTGWDQARFAATMQPYFLALGLGTIAARLGADPAAWPALSGPTWCAVACAMALGVVCGEVLSRRLPVRSARATAIAIAFVGGVLTVVDGVAPA